MGVAEEIENLARPLAAGAGVEIVQVQFQREPTGWVLRFFLDKEGGFGLADCTAWTHKLGDLVEQSGLVTQNYALEVSSPGLNRPLRKKEEFERYMGLDAIVKTFAPLNNQRNFHGTLKGFQNDEVWLLDRTNGLVKIPFASIAAAKLDPPAEF